MILGEFSSLKSGCMVKIEHRAHVGARNRFRSHSLVVNRARAGNGGTSVVPNEGSCSGRARLTIIYFSITFSIFPTFFQLCQRCVNVIQGRVEFGLVIPE